VLPHGKESQSAIAANRIGPHANAVASGTSDADDTMTFHRMMAGVAPLGAKGKSRVLRSSDAPARLTTPTLSEAKRAAESEAELAMTHLSALVHDQNDATRFEVTDDGSRVEGRRIDVPPALMRQLRRGMLPIDAKLDLHGHTASQAIDALVTFLQSMRARQERCVLVIHGKGERIAGSGVLRGEMAAWLSQGKARDHVAAFATARNADGGEGAIYILLRR
jgi:DNA-nicking Smr family endonuclease